MKRYSKHEYRCSFVVNWRDEPGGYTHENQQRLIGEAVKLVGKDFLNQIEIVEKYCTPPSSDYNPVSYITIEFNLIRDDSGYWNVVAAARADGKNSRT